MDPPNQSQPIIPFPIAGTPLASTRGTYVVGTLIGDGHYGSVYEAMGPFDQLYALKMFRPANRHYETVKQEWSAEMKRLESFRHPNIVYIYDAFEVNHLFYLTLERCETSLRAMMVKPLPDGLLIELTRQLLMALSYLHDMGLVHSDLHGGNVLVTQLQTRPVIKLTDFGVAHQLTGQHWFRPQVANPKILTPELVTAGYTTRQSDLYQVGLLMYRMHTGRSAIDEGVQYHDLTRLIAEGAPRFNAERLGTPIGNIVAKLLRRRDAYRYQSAREVWEDVRQLKPKGFTGQFHAFPIVESTPPAPSVQATQVQGTQVQSTQVQSTQVQGPPSSRRPQVPPAQGSYPGAVPQAPISQSAATPRQRTNTPTPPMGAMREPIATPPMGMPALNEANTERLAPAQRTVPAQAEPTPPAPPSSDEGRSRTGTLPPGPPPPSGLPFREKE